jgi:phenylalanyl-tRNA synthetase beta chain
VIEGRFPSPIGSDRPRAEGRGCPHFAGRLIRGVKNGPSPDWLQARLKAIGLRPISALVDITNYFTFGLNRPLHVFDAAKVKAQPAHPPREDGRDAAGAGRQDLHAAPGRWSSPMTTARNRWPGSWAAKHSGCTGTTDVFLESAWWDPITIAATGRALKINSDARYRFERGVDPAFTLPGLELATQMILDLCGGEAGTVVQDGAPSTPTRSYQLNPARVVSLVGMEIPEADPAQTLRRLASP